MAKETKVGLLIGLALILLVGIILSDLVKGPPPAVAVEEQAEGFGAQAQNNIYAPPAPLKDRSFDRPGVLSRPEPSTPSAFQTQPAFGQDTPAFELPTAPTNTAGEADREFAPPPHRRPDLPEPETMEAAAPRVAELPQAWRVDRTAAATPTTTTNVAFSPNTSPAPDETLSATPEDRSVFIPPPVAPTAPSAHHGSDTFHRVGPRDTLASVARKHYGNVSFATGLAKANPGMVGFGGVLQPGDQLTLPSLNSPHFRSNTPLMADAAPAAPSHDDIAPEPLPRPQRAAGADALNNTIKVGAGDTLSGLAARHLGSSQRWDDLLDANQDILKRPEALREGMVLKLPQTAGTPATPKPTQARPTAVASTSSPAAGNSHIYRVKPGDTLSGIARKKLGNAQRWDDLLQANADLLDSPEDLREGMKLTLPNASGTSATAPATTTTRPTVIAMASPTARTYTVRSGDNLTQIARRELGDGQRWDEIFDANRDQMDSPSALREGQTLRMP